MKGPPSRRLRAAIAVGVAACACAGVAFWLSRARRDAAWLERPPAADVAGADDAVRDAVAAARSAVEREPGSARAWGHLGMVLLIHDEIAPAAACLEQAGLRDGNDPRWPYLEALAFLKGDPDPQGAIRLLERSAALAGAPAAVRAKLGETLLEQGQLDAAERELRSALEKEPKDPRILAGLGRVAYRRGDLKAALEHLAASSRAAPGVKATRALLAEVHHRLGNETAATAEKQAMSALPDSLEWRDPFWEEAEERRVGALAEIERASGLLERGRGPEAIELLRSTAKRYPASSLVHLSLGRFLVQLGKAAEAEEVLRRAAAIAPEAFEAHHELGSALLAEDKIPEAAACFATTLRHKPDFPPAHFLLGQCRLRAGDAGGAIESLRAAVRYRPSYARAHRDLGQLLVANGSRAEGLDHLRAAVRLNPSDAEARRMLEAAER